MSDEKKSSHDTTRLLGLEPFPEGPPLQINIPDHQLLHRIGQGSYGEIWLAQNVLGQYRAVKLVFRSSFAQARPYEREFHGIQCFEPISRSHEGLIDILQVGRNDEDGYFYYVMELADDASGNDTFDPDRYESKTLDRVLPPNRRLPIKECLQLGGTLASAVAHLHHHGLIHRDIKPTNIVFVDGVPKLADIGLVTGVGTDTIPGGTIGYIAPEGVPSPQADIFSLGKVLYEISTGLDRQDYPKLPAEAHTLPDANLLSELNEIILKACDADPKVRYSSAKKLHEHLLRLQRSKSIRPVLWLERKLILAKRVASFSLIPIILVVVIFWFLNQSDTSLQDPARTHMRLAETAAERGDFKSALVNRFDALQLVRGDEQKESETHSAIVLDLQQIPAPPKLLMHIGNDIDLRFSQHGTKVMACDRQTILDVYDRKVGRFLFSRSPESPMLSATFSSDENRIFIVATNGIGQLWDASSGQTLLTPQFQDDFSKPSNAWKFLPRDSSDAHLFSYRFYQETLQIQVKSGAKLSGGMAVLAPPNFERHAYYDITASFDLVNWDTNALGCAIGFLVSRTAATNWGEFAYMGMIVFNDADSSDNALLSIYGGSQGVDTTLNPQKDYRLSFTVIADELYLGLFELPDLEKPFAFLSAPGSRTQKPGGVGFWINANWGNSHFDVTVDNFIVTGITR